LVLVDVILSSHYRLTVDPRNSEYIIVVHYKSLSSFLHTEGITLPTTPLSTTGGWCLQVLIALPLREVVRCFWYGGKSGRIVERSDCAAEPPTRRRDAVAATRATRERASRVVTTNKCTEIERRGSDTSQTVRRMPDW